MSNDSLVFLGMPGYGQLTAGASRGFWRSTRRPDSNVVYKYNHGSLLGNNFNHLWCDALNLCRRGAPLQYFAMQHADIEPEDWWLDKAVGLLDTYGLDVLGVSIPIKSHDGLTSLALDRPDGNTWRPLCRLSTAEVRSLPPVFTSEDIGYRLLLNTGLWVCRFDPSWASLVRFTINDRIVTLPSGDYAPEVEPEDWYVSRLFHELKLKIGATRLIKAQHQGPIDFPNDRAWGEPHDSAYVDGSILKPIRRGDFTFPADVDGWLSFDEGEALFDLARGKRVLEIGSYCGRSTVCLAQSAASVVSVDPHDGRSTPRPMNTFTKLRWNLDRYGLSHVETRIGTVDDAPMSPYDLVFVDGAHDFASVSHDIAEATKRLAPGGLLAFHDYEQDDPGVTKAVKALGARGAELVSVTDTLAVVRPPAALLMEV